MLRTTLITALCLLGLQAHAQVDLPLPAGLDPKIETILAPLNGVPTIQRADELLAVELAAGAAQDPLNIRAWLIPSFGQIRPRIDIGGPVVVQAGIPSTLWPKRQVDSLRFVLPADLLPDLYDLHVNIPGDSPGAALSGEDHQRRALSIVADYPASPRVVVIADPSVGDPRPLQDAALDAIQRQEYEQALAFAQRSVGNPMTAERWAAFAQVVREINLVQPDFVIITGDLTFAVHPQGVPYEYDDAWKLLDKLEVPAFLSPGNHDLYALDDYSGQDLSEVDGKELWQLFFGPLRFGVDIGPKLHLVSINTFDWPTLEPFPAWDDFDTLAGGQILPEQMAWLEQELLGYRARNPDGTLITFAHHDPSWIQNRHPWKGEGRLESRDLFAAAGVAAHFSGHTHEDRVARYYEGDIVETNGRPHRDHTVRELHLILRDNTFVQDGLSQDQLGTILREPTHGPLFVSTTTASSQLAGDVWGLGGYWGWRLMNWNNIAGQGFDPIDLGYPATEEFLARRAERPENWTAAHAQFGLFSYPSFELTAEPGESSITLQSGLLADLQVSPLLQIAAEPGQALAADGGEIMHVRYGDGLAQARVRASLPAGGSLSLRLRHANSPTATRNGTDPGRGGALSWLWLCLLLQIHPALRRRTLAAQAQR